MLSDDEISENSGEKFKKNVKNFKKMQKFVI